MFLEDPAPSCCGRCLAGGPCPPAGPPAAAAERTAIPPAEEEQGPGPSRLSSSLLIRYRLLQGL